MSERLRGLASRLTRAPSGPPEHDDRTSVLIGTLLTELHRSRTAVTSLQEVEFQVFSQFGDDGIIQYLTGRLDLPRALQVFVEFGVEDYTESNTRFLLIRDNWRGLILDGSEDNIEAIKRHNLYWRHDLTAVAAFVDRENINRHIAGNGVEGAIGLLSIDIDGNDYWVWEALDVVDPAVVVVEYNSVFGADRAVSVPYDPAFRRGRAHYSQLYWGCSLPALVLLAGRKGYRFLGCNRAGNNSYFARADVADLFPAPSVADGYVESRFRESRGRDGNMSYLRGRDRLEVMRDLPLIDVETGESIRVGDV